MMIMKLVVVLTSLSIYQISMITQMTITIADVFAFPDKLITTKGNILVIKVSILSPQKI